MTVSSFYNDVFKPWLERMVETGQKSHATLKTYGRYWDTYLAPHFNGTKTLKNYAPYMGTQFLEDLRKDDGEPFGANTVAHIHSAASGIFSRAVSLNYISHNPWNDVKKRDVPTTNAEEGVAYSERTVELMIQNLELAGEKDAPLVLAIGIWAGLRPSEITGLKWEAIDLDRGTIRVHQAVVYGREKNTTKTGRERIVHFLSPLAGHLRAWKAASHNPTSGRVFQNREGKPVDLNTLSCRVIGPNCKKNGIEWERIAYYGCRRGYGTLLVNHGASCEEVAQSMGNTRDVVWKYYFKDAECKLGARAAARYETAKLAKGRAEVGQALMLTRLV